MEEIYKINLFCTPIISYHISYHIYPSIHLYLLSVCICLSIYLLSINVFLSLCLLSVCLSIQTCRIAHFENRTLGGSQQLYQAKHRKTMTTEAKTRVPQPLSPLMQSTQSTCSSDFTLSWRSQLFTAFWKVKRRGVSWISGRLKGGLTFLRRFVEG